MAYCGEIWTVCPRGNHPSSLSNDLCARFSRVDLRDTRSRHFARVRVLVGRGWSAHYMQSKCQHYHGPVSSICTFSSKAAPSQFVFAFTHIARQIFYYPIVFCYQRITSYCQPLPRILPSSLVRVAHNSIATGSCHSLHIIQSYITLLSDLSGTIAPLLTTIDYSFPSIF